MEVMKEETFGPLVPVMRVKDPEEALRLSNDTHLGLNATVFGPRKKAVAFARRLQSGQVMVNDVLVNYFVVESPLGGWKASGLGVRHGIESLRQWTRTEAITEGRPLLAPLERLVARKLAFPYDARFLGLIRRASRLLPPLDPGEAPPPPQVHCLLKNCTAFSCFFAAASDLKVPRFFRFPVFGSFFRE